MNAPAVALLTAGVAYLLGSVSAAHLVARARGIDLRGSADIPKVLGARAGGLVFLADFLKAQLAVGFAWSLGGDPWFAALACLAVSAGEAWPLFHGFRGGRAEASAAGGLLGLSPFTLLICATGALLVWSLTDRRDHAALIAVLLLPAVAIFVGGGDLPLMSLAILLAGLLLWTHREVLGELLGTEGKETN